MASRLDLHSELVKVLGTNNVYFQPPESLKLIYPCIVYERSDIRSFDADNKKYLKTHHYTITVIDKDPDSKIVENISELQKIRFIRHFATEGLNHDVFEIYY